MTDKPIIRMSGGALVAIAAGLAAALLFVLAARASYLTMALGYFAPLPIMVAALSFGLTIGAGAALVGAAFVALVFHPMLGAFFLLSIGAPAALIAAAALLAPPAAATLPNATRHRDLAPTYAIVAAALIAAVTVSCGVAYISWRLGGFDGLLARAIKDGAPLIRDMLGDAQATSPIGIEDLTRLLVRAAPVGVAASELLMMTFNLWLAGRVAIISGNLPRPWPALANDLAIPPLFGALFALACGLSFLGGLAGVVSSIFAAALGAAFALQGLAALHVLTRKSTLRFALLFALYALIMLLPPWPFCLLAIVGLVDAAFHLRTRASVSHPEKA